MSFTSLQAAPPPPSRPEPPALGRARHALRGQVGAYAAFSVAITLLLLVPTIYMLQVYDRVLTSRNGTTLVMLSLLALGLLALLAALDAVRGELGVRLAGAVQRQLDPALFEAALQPPAGITPARLAADVATVRQFGAGPLPAAIVDLPLATLFIAAAFVFHPLLGGFVCAAIAAIAMLAWWHQRRAAQPLAAARQAIGAATAALDEASRQAETARALGMTDALQSRWQQAAQRAAAAQQRAEAQAAAAASCSRGLRLVAQSGALAVGAWLVLRQEITAGMMIATGVLLGRALSPVEVLVGQARGLAALRDSWLRLCSALPAHDAPAALQLPAARGELRAEGLGARAGADEPWLLQAVSLHLEPGRTLALVGGSGAGKSTLARLLAGAAAPDAGSVRLDGAVLQQWPQAQRAAALGWLPQEVHLFAGTVAENIARMGLVDDTAVLLAAQAAGVHELVLRLPEGYHTRIGAGGVRLSGGQRQRIALARALYGEPRLLVLDEPDAHLDEGGERALRQALQAHRARGGTTVLATHRQSLLALADDVLVLAAGRVVAQGPREQLFAAGRADAAATTTPLRRA